jgi:hypothetical protein
MESVASKNVSDVGGSSLKRLGSILAGPPNNVVFSALFDCTMAGLQDRLALAPPKVNQAEQDAAEAENLKVKPVSVAQTYTVLQDDDSDDEVYFEDAE